MPESRFAHEERRRKEGGLLRMNNDVTARVPRSGSDVESDRTSERTNVLSGHELAAPTQRYSELFSFSSGFRMEPRLFSVPCLYQGF